MRSPKRKMGGERLALVNMDGRTRRSGDDFHPVLEDQSVQPIQPIISNRTIHSNQSVNRSDLQSVPSGQDVQSDVQMGLNERRDIQFQMGMGERKDIQVSRNNRMVRNAQIGRNIERDVQMGRHFQRDAQYGRNAQSGIDNTHDIQMGRPVQRDALFRRDTTKDVQMNRDMILDNALNHSRLDASVQHDVSDVNMNVDRKFNMASLPRNVQKRDVRVVNTVNVIPPSPERMDVDIDLEGDASNKGVLLGAEGEEDLQSVSSNASNTSSSYADRRLSMASIREVRPTFANLKSDPEGVPDSSVDLILDIQRLSAKTSKDPLELFKFAKSCLAAGERVPHRLT